jgi:aryl-alcohol dehydrogenase-like predicted oxidoreductase
MAHINGTDLELHGLCLGGNVFGWTADEEASFAVLDAYVAAGGNVIDTADVYSKWVPGHTGGESEEVIGRWLAARGNREDIVIATKVGGEGGLSADNIRTRAEASLQRLGVEHIDLYYAHYDDPETSLEESLGAFDALVRDGKVRYLAASNYAPERLAEALAVADREGFARYVAFQQHYNLVERDFEDGLREVCEREGLGTLPYFSLAKGFLTGKYRTGGDAVDSPRAEGAAAYLDERGDRVLDTLDEVAAAHDVPVAAVSLAWLAAQPTVVAPIASARSREQLEQLLPMAELELSADELARLDAASRPA